jgi:hypothetical protein
MMAISRVADFRSHKRLTELSLHFGHRPKILHLPADARTAVYVPDLTR